MTKEELLNELDKVELTKDDLKRIMLKHFVRKGLFGRKILDLNYLDFSDFYGDVYISYMKVTNGDLFQHYQEVQGELYQDNQKVHGNLYQSNQKVSWDLYQKYQEVHRDLFQDKQDVQGDLYQKGQKVNGEIYQDKPEE